MPKEKRAIGAKKTRERAASTFQALFSSGEKARRQAIILIASGTLIALLIIAALVCGGLGLLLPFFLLLGLALVLTLGSFALVLFSFAQILTGDKESSASLSGQLDAFRLGEARTVDPNWPLETTNRLQAKLNDTILFLDTFLSGIKDREGKKAPTRAVLPFREFAEKVPLEASANPSHLSGVFAFSLVGEDAGTPAALTALEKAVREAFPDDLMGRLDEPHGIAVYVYAIDSRTAFLERLSSFVSGFSFVEKRDGNKKVSVFGCKAGGAFYPGVEPESLPFAAKRSLLRSTGVDADYGKDLDYASPFSGPRLSEVSERVESLRFAEATSDRLFSSKDAGASREALIALTRFYGEFAGFSAGGCYVYDPRVDGYRLFLSYGSEDGYVGLAKLGEKVDAAVLDPYYERAEKDFPLFVSTAQGLGKDFATELLSLGISSLFLYPVRNGSAKVGLFYFAAPRGFELRLLAREKLLEFLPLSYASLFAERANNDRNYHVLELNNLASRKEFFLYTVERKTHRLLSFTDNLAHKLKGAKPGLPCHKALYGLDAPCLDCPLTQGSLKRAIPEISNKEVSESVLAYREGNEDIATILLEKDEGKALATSLIDKSLLVKNARAFQIDINRELRNDLASGYFLGIRLQNKETLLLKLKDQNTNSLMSAIARELGSIGYDEATYRFDPDTLVVAFPGLTNRTSLIVSVETIADAISGTLYVGEDSFNPEYSYSLIAYPSDATTPNDLVSLLQSELLRSARMGIGVIAEVGKAKGRKALRFDYIQSLLNERLRAKRMDLEFTPVADSTTGVTKILKAAPALYEEGRKKIRAREFLRIAKLSRMQEMVDFACLRQFFSFYQSNADTLFRAQKISYLLYPCSPSSVSGTGAIERLLKLKQEFSIPDNFLILSFSAKSTSQNAATMKQVVMELHKGGISVLCDQLTPGTVPLAQLSEIGVDGIVASPYFLEEALNGESDRLLYGSYVRDARSLGLVELSAGVSSEDGKKFIQGLGIPYYAGPILGEGLSEDDLISFLHYR